MASHLLFNRFYIETLKVCPGNLAGRQCNTIALGRLGILLLCLLSPVRCARRHQDHSHRANPVSAPQPAPNAPSDLVLVLQQIAVDQTVIMTQASCGFLDFAENWILHAQLAGVSNWLTIVEDDQSLQYLTEKYDRHIVPVSFFPDFTLNNATGFINNDGSDAFNTLMCNRLIYQQAVLELGYKVVWSDIDTAWFQNPMSLFPNGYDFIGVDDQWPWETTEQESGYVCGCLSVWAPTPLGLGTHKAWMEDCFVTQGDDQVAWVGIFQGELRQKLKYYIMPRQLFPSGRTMDEFEFAPQEDPKRPKAIPPVWIHANHRRGQAKKHEYFLSNKAWKIDTSNAYPQCHTEE